MPLFKLVFRGRRREVNDNNVTAVSTRGGRPGLLEEWRVLAHYTVGPVKYYIYKDDLGNPRLRFEEPPPPPDHVVKDIAAGIREPSTEEERYYFEKYSSGYGSIYPLVIDGNIEEIAVEGAGRDVSAIHRLFPGRWISVDVRLSRDEVDSLAVQMARKAGKSISLAVPMAEGLTPEGYRVAVTLSNEVSRFGSSIVVRKYPEKPLTLGDLIASRVISPLAAAYLWILVETQQFILIVGSMGAGKTTLLQAIASLIPPFYRVITIEDTPELKLPVPRWDALVTRHVPPGEQLEEVDLESLLKFALRRRAEYVIVGEVRGREARLLAQAAASGHGSMTTLHADSPEGAVLRLQLEPISLPPIFLSLIGSIVHVRRLPTMGGRAKRRVFSITEIQGEELVDIFTWDPHEDSFKPVTPEEVAERSVSLKRASERLPDVMKDVVMELSERAELLERIAGEPPEAFNRAVTMFYMKRYGGG